MARPKSEDPTVPITVSVPGTVFAALSEYCEKKSKEENKMYDPKSIMLSATIIYLTKEGVKIMDPEDYYKKNK